MNATDVLPEIRQIIGAMLFAAKKPVTVKEIRKALAETADRYGDPFRPFAQLTEKEVTAAVHALMESLPRSGSGLCIVEVAGGFRLQNEVNCGPWVRSLLEKERSSKLSKPALETLAIVAYRQPVLRSEIEAVRGVAVDQVLRNLVEMQLVKVVARSELPGRPWLFGTTRRFLEHFGLRSLDDLPGMEELRRAEAAGKPAETEPFPEIEKELQEREDQAATETYHETGLAEKTD